jgi:hypothetical protein
MEAVAADIVGPYLTDADPGFESIVAELYAWRRHRSPTSVQFSPSYGLAAGRVIWNGY